ncbi:CocE/NonD family hydrolase [Pendulispora albinea]|uniref:CocE/NonD family hydrolase n=1 Tax=Pendulispora albinea TaxID=2741071 RepID=A0ABZ2LRX8_9BACT
MRTIAFTLCLFTAACGAASPSAVAEPRKAESAESPLIAAQLADNTDIARALREHYTKYDYLVPMRDGVRLYTTFYVPKDKSRTYPILLKRTPYAVKPYGSDHYPNADEPRLMEGIAPSVHFLREGYILVRQDVRGRFMSEGTFVDVRPRATKKGEIDESTDTYDTIDWLVKNVPSNNGKAGLWGISYPGFYAAQGAIDAHPALKAISPQAPVTEWFIGDDWHHQGAFMLGDAFDFYVNFGKSRPKPTKKVVPWFDYDSGDIYEFFLALGPLSNANTRYLENQVSFWNDLMQHGTRDDFWKARDPRPHYKNVRPAIMTVGGWFDAEDAFGALETYRTFERQNPGANNTLVMGPWSHGGWARMDGDRLGDIGFGAKQSLFYREQIEFPFFQRYLKGKSVAPPPEAWAFETGTNTWQRFAAWPPAEAKPVFISFQDGGKLSASPAAAATGTGAAGARANAAGAANATELFDAYVSDPAKPVPYRDRVSSRIDHDYVVEDQRFASRRPDVLTYSTGVLEGDVTLVGPIEASLWVSTTGTDADFVVKLIDVYPSDYPDPTPNPTGVHMGGYQQLVRGEVMRGKFRNSYENPAPFKPGEPTLVRFTTPDTFHTFRAGHRIMVQVQSSWFPLVDRNPQTFTDIYRATEADFRAATHRVYRAPAMPSGIKVGLLRGKL